MHEPRDTTVPPPTSADVVPNLVIVAGVIPGCAVLVAMAKWPSLQTSEEIRWGLLYPLTYLAAAAFVRLSVRKKGFRVLQVVGLTTTLALIVPIGEAWTIGLHRTRLVPPWPFLLILLPPFFINFWVLVRYRRLPDSRFAGVILALLLVAAALASCCWRTIEPIVNGYQSQYRVATKILELQSRYSTAYAPSPHVTWRDFNVVGVWASQTDIAIVRPSPVQAFQKLEYLDLSGTDVTDNYLEGIETLSKLRQLKVNGTDVTDLTISRLVNLPDLYSLEASGAQVTDGGLKWISRFQSLQSIDLGRSTVSSVGIRLLARSEHLMKLSLRHSRLNDADLEPIGEIVTLIEIDLASSPGITDKVLEHLLPLPKLERINLRRTAVTTAAVEEFMKRYESLHQRSCYVDLLM